MGAIVAVIGSRAKTELAERLKPMLQRSRIVVRLIGSWLVWFGDAVIPWRGAKSATFRCDAIFCDYLHEGKSDGNRKQPRFDKCRVSPTPTPSRRR